MADSAARSKGDRCSHTDLVLNHESLLRRYIDNSEPLVIGEDSLSLATVVATARHHRTISLSIRACEALRRSRTALEQRIDNGEIIYGVNTGFGGTADVRTKQTEELQRVLIRELHYGILSMDTQATPSNAQSHGADDFGINQEIGRESSNLPSTWVRAAILIRINSLLKGCSGIRVEILERLKDLLAYNIIPLIPLRGSISASGDLSPLSYIGGAIQGKRTIRVLTGKRGDIVSRSDEAFATHNLEPIKLQAKEGLAIVNGTAISAAGACLIMHDVHGLTLAAQALSAMAVEVLQGTKESFHPFFAEVRPHPGQIEAARNILHFLGDSALVQENTGADTSLRQDRYSIRTAAQWIGPVLEDIALAHQQVEIESNSATDNPLVGPDGELLHGGNFQAQAITSALEKTRQGLNGIGRMLFSQCTEMINPATSRGLPPNLVVEDPSSSYIFKGMDINVAALQAELGFLASPVNHVMTAEMGNQSINSLALISARYTADAVEVLSQLVASHLFTSCQALDLRALQLTFWASVYPEFEALFDKHFAIMFTGPQAPQTAPESLLYVQTAQKQVWKRILLTFDQTASLDAVERFARIARSINSVLFEQRQIQASSAPFESVNTFIEVLEITLYDAWITHVSVYQSCGDAAPFLGHVSRRIYRFVRQELGVPLLHASRLRTPRVGADNRTSLSQNMKEDNPEAMTVGAYLSRIYHAVKAGLIGKLVSESLPRNSDSTTAEKGAAPIE